MSNKTLSEQEQRLASYMAGRPYGTDIPISELYYAVFDADYTDFRVAQQRLGSVVSKINRKRSECKIEPGRVKRTYRLERKTNDV